MSVSTIHYLHGILLPSAAFISELTDTSPKSTTEFITGFAAGHPQPLFQGVRGQKPEISFRSPQLAVALGALGLFGLDTSAGNTDLFYKLATDLGSRTAAASTAHKRFRATQGLMYWRSIKATHQQDAEIDCRYCLTWDGTNNPVVPAGSIALSGTSVGTEWYTLGPVMVNGSQLPGVQDVTIDLGLNMNERGSDGEIWPTFANVKDCNPVVTVNTLDLDSWSALGLAGQAITSLIVYFRKKAANGHNVPNATPSHISFTATNGIEVPENISAGVNNEAMTTIPFKIAAPNAAGNVFTINTATAIT
jgi:hypothetical protein